MATALTAAVSSASSKLTSFSLRTSSIPYSDVVTFKKIPVYYRNVSGNGNAGVIMAVADVAPPAKVEKHSKKMEEDVIVNRYKPKEPYPGEIPYREGQSVGVIPDGVGKNRKPHKLSLYSIAINVLGDFGDAKTVSLCVTGLVYTNDAGEVVKGVCSNFSCDLKPGYEVKLTGPVGKEKLMQKDQNATIIMLRTGTGVALFRSFLWKIIFEKHEVYKFSGSAWLLSGVPTSSSLLYKEDFEKMREKAPHNFRLDFAVSREQTNDKGDKIYIQMRMAH